MLNWTFYPVLLGTLVSMFGLSQIAVQNRSAASPKSLSELVAAEEALLRRFRNILLLCGMLFGITVFGFIAPRSGNALPVTVFGILMIGGELIAAIVPAHGKTLVPHLVLAHAMAIGMLGLGVTFSIALTGMFAALAAVLTVGMVAFSALTFADKRHYMVYELAFIFSSHFSVVVAALALK